MLIQAKSIAERRKITITGGFRVKSWNPIKTIFLFAIFTASEIPKAMAKERIDYYRQGRELG